MKLSIQRERLIRPLSHVNSVVEKRQTLPILGNVYLKHDGESLWLIGTDLETEVTARIDKVTGDGGECTVAARKLFDITRALPEDAEIQLDGKSDKTLIKAGTSRFSLQTLPAGDFPRIDTEKWQRKFTIEKGTLKKLLDKTAFCMAQQDVRYYLNGLLLEVGEGILRAVATDGHRLGKSEVAIENSAAGEQIIVPRKAVLEISRLLGEEEGEAVVSIGTNHIRVELAGLVFTAKLIDGRFPDYQKVIPRSLATHILVDRTKFYDVLVRAAILTNEKFRGVRLSLSGGRMRVTAHNPEQEEAMDELAVDYQGEELEIGFNVGYLMEALRAVETEEVDVGVEDANSSCTLESPADDVTLYLVMPMRL